MRETVASRHTMRQLAQEWEYRAGPRPRLLPRTSYAVSSPYSLATTPSSSPDLNRGFFFQGSPGHGCPGPAVKPSRYPVQAARRPRAFLHSPLNVIRLALTRSSCRACAASAGSWPCMLASSARTSSRSWSCHSWSPPKNKGRSAAGRTGPRRGSRLTRPAGKGVTGVGRCQATPINVANLSTSVSPDALWSEPLRFPSWRVPLTGGVARMAGAPFSFKEWIASPI